MKKSIYYLSIFFLVCFWLFLISDIVLGVIRPAPRFSAEVGDEIFSPMGSGARMLASFSFWTTWSNWMLAIFFTCVLIKPSKKIDFNVWTVMSAYMTLTMLLFWMGLAGVKAVGEGFQINFINDYSDPIRLTYSIILHLVSPAVVIGAWIYKCGRQRINEQAFNKFWLVIGIGVLVIYMIFVLTRGTIRLNQGYDIYTSYPYFFFAISVEKGTFMLSITLIFIIFLVAGLMIGLTKINNKVALKRQISEEPQLAFEIKLINNPAKAKFIFLILAELAGIMGVAFGIWLLTEVPEFYQETTSDDFTFYAINYILWPICLSVWIISGLNLIISCALVYRFKVLEFNIKITLLILGVTQLFYYGVGLLALGLFLWAHYSVKPELKFNSKSEPI